MACIFGCSSDEKLNVWMAMELARSRTISVTASAWITSAFSHSEPSGIGWRKVSVSSTCTTVGDRTVPIAVGAFTPWLDVDVELCAGVGMETAPRTAASANSATRILDFFIDRYLQRLQKLDVLRRDFDLCFRMLFLQRVLVHPDVERFQEAPVLRGHF